MMTRRCHRWDPGKAKRQLWRDLAGALVGDLIGDEGKREFNGFVVVGSLELIARVNSTSAFVGFVSDESSGVN